MLKNISPLFSPELLAVIYRMGHGEEIVFADAHFPMHQFNDTVIRADGLKIPALLDAVLPLFQLDQYVDAPLAMMDVVPGDKLDPTVEEAYRTTLSKYSDSDLQIERVERFAFYERVKQAHAVVATGDTAKYGNIILKKGVTPIN